MFNHSEGTIHIYAPTGIQTSNILNWQMTINSLGTSTTHSFVPLESAGPLGNSDTPERLEPMTFFFGVRSQQVGSTDSIFSQSIASLSRFGAALDNHHTGFYQAPTL